ncbi:MAG: alpha/beta hydrolase [Actinomycetota bacterium]
MFLTKRRIVVLAIMAMGASVAVFLTTSQSNGWSYSDYQKQRITWLACGGPFLCTDVTVPVDYSNPGGERMQLSLVKYPATDSKKRLGALLVNPGGPGASGVQYGYAAEYIVSKEVLEAYDLIGFDPRGVGGSSAERCLTNSETDRLIEANGPPVDGLDMATLEASSKMLATRCQEKLGNRLKFLGSVEVVRDMDLMRAVLGEEKLNFLGKSYGTYLGLVYASMFPKNVGRFVLDGVVDPKLSANELNKAQAIGFEIALDAFLEDCLPKKSCFFQGTLEQARAEVTKLQEKVGKRALNGKDDRLATSSIFVLAMVASLYDSETGWSALNKALKDIYQGEGARLFDLVNDYVVRDAKGRYPSNENEIAYIVNCIDRTDDASPERLASDARKFSGFAPHFGPYIAWSTLPCHYWPYEPVRPPVELNGAGAAEIIAIGTTRDPATPYAWATEVTAKFESAFLITADGDGHTGHGRGSACVDSAVDTYLLSGELPARPLRCAL